MYKVGITGGIGTGKSIVCRIFAILGVPVYDADSRAKWLMEHHFGIRAALIAWFGEEVYSGNVLNRSLVASVAFKDPAATAKLNQLIHPAVKEDFLEWANQHQQAPYVLKEAALLFEAGSYKDMDRMIVVSAPKEVRMERILQRDPHRNRTQILDIMERQWPDDKKSAMADNIIYNDERSLVVDQVLQLHQLFLSKALL